MNSSCPAKSRSAAVWNYTAFEKQDGEAWLNDEISAKGKKNIKNIALLQSRTYLSGTACNSIENFAQGTTAL